MLQTQSGMFSRVLEASSQSHSVPFLSRPVDACPMTPVTPHVFRMMLVIAHVTAHAIVLASAIVLAIVLVTVPVFQEDSDREFQLHSCLPPQAASGSSDSGRPLDYRNLILPWMDVRVGFL